MKRALISVFAITIGSCAEPEPKTGTMPGIATGGYEAPTNGEASAAFMAAFQARYDIPELNYPDDIKARIQAARLKKLKRDMRVAAKRQEIVSKLVLTAMARKDPEAKRLLQDIKDNPEASEDASSMDWINAFMDAQPKKASLSPSERNAVYQSTIHTYKKAFRNLEIESCRWTEMTRLIGSGHEAMAKIHGEHPTHGYRCVGEMKTEQRKGYPRFRDFHGFWIKSETGDWRYYGQFRGVGVAARRQSLDPELLKNPEKVIARESSWDRIISQLN